MTTSQSTIRPRPRVEMHGVEQAKDKQTQPHVRGKGLPGGNSGSRQTSQSPAVLARLPELVDAPIGKPLSLKLSWVLNFRWQDRLRRLVQMEPNYLAGGVLALVVFLLVMITMRNRDTASAAIADSATAPTAAPVQATPAAETSIAALQPQQPDSTAVNASQVVAQARVHAEAAAPVVDTAATHVNTPAPAQDPLAGIYYPRTPFDAPAGVSFEQVAGKPVAAFAAVSAAGPADGVRTALRDRSEQRDPQAPQTEPVARLDGIITRSR
jgi:hypothetical protein